MKKIMFVLLTAIMLASMFVTVKQAKAVTNGMVMDPVEKVVDPPMDGSDLTFLWQLNISTTYLVSSWEAKLLWDPAVLKCLDVTFGDFMTPGSSVDNQSKISGGGESVLLGQYYKLSLTSTGDGVLATIKFTFVLPGVTQLWFVESKVWDDALNEYNLLPPTGDTLNCRVISNRPHPSFTWKTDDGINPCPIHTVYDQGRDISTTGTTVHFNGSLSYDVGNVYWDGSAWAKDGGYPDITAFLWEYGDGAYDYYTGVNFSTTTDHVFPDYKKAGYLVNMTIWDSEDEWWSSTWRYQGPVPSNTVPMWRDIAIVDIWPSLPPYELWDEYGIDWGEYWGFDSVNYVIPNTNDNYWNYKVDFPSWGYPPGTTVKSAYNDWGSEGLYINVAGNNFGTVPEKVTIRLYALALDYYLKVSPPPLETKFTTFVEKIGEWKKTMKPNSGTGLGGCVAIWLPPKNGTYLLFATIESQDSAAVHDGDTSNNYMLLSQPMSNQAVWQSNPGLYMVYAEWLCDIDGNGKVGSSDFALFSKYFGTRPVS